MEAVKKFAVDGVMGVVAHPFVPYMVISDGVAQSKPQGPRVRRSEGSGRSLSSRSLLQM